MHAHPDDETLNNGGTMAAAAAAGCQVTLVTCTRGELGAVVAADLAHLRDDPEALGAHRETELAAACRALGVRDHAFLGAPQGVRYRDSGMAWRPDGTAGPAPGVAEGAFATTDTEQAARLLAETVRRTRPHVVVTYERTGGYGHPDHVMTHHVTMRAVALSPPEWEVPRVLATVWPESAVRSVLRRMSESGAAWLDPDGPLPGMAVPDELVVAALDLQDHLAAKLDALDAHRTQLGLDREAMTVTQDDGRPVPVLPVECYQLLAGTPLPAGPPVTTVDGLLAGIDLTR